MPTLPHLIKQVGTVFPRNATAEADICVWNDELIIAAFNHGVASPLGLVIRKASPPMEAGEVLGHAPSFPGRMGVINDFGGTLCVHAVAPFRTAGNAVIASWLDSSYAPGSTVTLLTAPPGITFENVAITPVPGPDGYVMVVERFSGSTALPLHFYKAPAPDSTAWTFMGEAPATFTHPAGIDYVRGRYYVTVGMWDGSNSWAVMMRSINCATGSWQVFSGNARNPSNVSPLAKDYTCAEAIVGDLSYKEWRGILAGVYFNNDQATFCDAKLATYLGSLEDFTLEFFGPTSSVIAPNLTTNAEGQNGAARRQYIASGAFAGGLEAATSIRVIYKNVTSGTTTTISGAYIGHAATPPSFDGGQVPITFNGGQTSITMPAGTTEYASDWIPFSFNPAKGLIVTGDLSNPAALRYSPTVGGNYAEYYKFGGAHGHGGDTSVSGYGVVNGQISAIARIEIPTT